MINANIMAARLRQLAPVHLYCEPTCTLDVSLVSFSDVLLVNRRGMNKPGFELGLGHRAVAKTEIHSTFLTRSFINGTESVTPCIKLNCLKPNCLKIKKYSTRLQPTVYSEP